MGVLYVVTTSAMPQNDYEDKVKAIHEAITKGKISPNEGFALTGKLFNEQIMAFSRNRTSA